MLRAYSLPLPGWQQEGGGGWQNFHMYWPVHHSGEMDDFAGLYSTEHGFKSWRAARSVLSFYRWNILGDISYEYDLPWMGYPTWSLVPNCVRVNSVKWDEWGRLHYFLLWQSEDVMTCSEEGKQYLPIWMKNVWICPCLTLRTVIKLAKAERDRQRQSCLTQRLSVVPGCPAGCEQTHLMARVGDTGNCQHLI